MYLCSPVHARTIQLPRGVAGFVSVFAAPADYLYSLGCEGHIRCVIGMSEVRLTGRAARERVTWAGLQMLVVLDSFGNVLKSSPVPPKAARPL